ncbi:2-oxoglutarate dehydrogenase E1 subunit family protein, partial [Kribbia dieselivorans]|uniref:2-oxoglutarate dehydrogenase E1 subunit family protein n=1 Tax=Kribbia dieselivorans TaxID=331526 RepID=UPI000A9150AC
MPDHPASNNPLTAFGPNEWLVDELYEQYLTDKNLVDKAWWPFFAEYKGKAENGAAPAAAAAAPAPAATPAPAPAAKPAPA